MKLTVVTTGGTLDKIYFDAKSAYQVGDPQIGEILRAFDVAFEFDIVPLMRKDSLDLTDDDRQLIFDTVADHSNDRFLITHGTDTMLDTAQRLGPLGKENTIVFTGALNPARFTGSDAVFNIGTAVAACQAKPHGVYIAMNGRIWDLGSVRKNIEANRFEWIESNVT